MVEIPVEDSRPGLKKEMSTAVRPPHRLAFVGALVHDLVDADSRKPVEIRSSAR